jgi:hypothetical protein
MPGIQYHFQAVFDPESLLAALALWTMAVATTIIANLFFPAAIATQDMAAQSRGTAFS